ncbi:hypothetical protein ACHABX_02640 [Nesterenkonia halotolerans]|uniref:hypothetical protein n=1 Tax=Nesterenkonia halotolerans TaxID=225325 RepID=UPI003EE7C49F
MATDHYNLPEPTMDTLIHEYPDMLAGSNRRIDDVLYQAATDATGWSQYALEQLIGAVIDPPWTDLRPYLVNGWEHYQGSLPAFRIVGGMVELQGFIRSGTTTTLLNMPPSASPDELVWISLYNRGDSNAVPATVDTAGNVEMNGVGGGESGSGAWTVLTGVRYPLKPGPSA